MKSFKKQRQHFADKGPSSQSYGLSSNHVWMWELDHKEGWAPKNWCFRTWCQKRLLRVPWTARRSNQSILKKINPEYSLQGLMLRLQYFGYFPHVKSWLNRKISWDQERLKAVGEGDNRDQNDWMASLTQWTWGWANARRWWGTGLGVLQSMESQSQTWLSNWKTIKWRNITKHRYYEKHTDDITVYPSFNEK